ncbi:hypothetical protein HPB49_022859 [Dermacentor silvarum]|uniref:Uncharacterized protein n=1 Tax=Dermacentor silvarum TaxID=543639 RepID=A0ACB8E3U7_DERSI|nr:hypothetical protein HPB49_022859 [Dermacentor silvarum]
MSRAPRIWFREEKALLEFPVPWRWWVKPIWENREEESKFHTAMPLLMNGDTEYFQKYYKMSPEKLEELHALVEGPLTKPFVVREPIRSRARLAITLRYMASGMQIQHIALAFRVGISTADIIIRETCKVPTTSDWQKVAEGFYEKWNFPHCVGAVGVKHVQIQAPPNSGSLYLNYKGTYSIVLMAIADSNLKFILVDAGAYGRQSDGGTLGASRLGNSWSVASLVSRHQNSYQNLQRWHPMFS